MDQQPPIAQISPKAARRLTCTIGILKVHADDALGTKALALQYHKGGCTSACIPILAIKLGKGSFAQKRLYNQKAIALAHKTGVASDRNGFPGAGALWRSLFSRRGTSAPATNSVGVSGQRIFPAN